MVGIEALIFADKRLCLSGGDVYSVILPLKFVTSIFNKMAISRHPPTAIIYKRGSIEGLYMEITTKDVRCQIFLL